MKIIHCSDLHLDSALGSNLSPEMARERNAELCATFGRMVRFAVRQQVRAVLIAGDLFDTDQVSGRTADYVLDQIRNAPAVTFFYIRGNHDECRHPFVGQKLPENLITFGSSWESHRCDDVVITAMEPDEKGWYEMYDQLKLHEEDTNIVMLHGQIATQAGAERIALPMLRGRHIQYLALGHLHAYQQTPLDADGVCCYCGCLEGRGFDECGEKGFVLLEICGKTIHSRLIPFASRTLHEIQVDITDTETVTQILGRLHQAAIGVAREDMVKFVLEGSYTPDTQKDTSFLQKILEEDFWTVKVRDESRLRIDPESYRYDASLKGAFVRLVLDSGCSAERKEQIITCGIRALSGEGVVL